MSDSCYLCNTGSPKYLAKPLGPLSAGFGTCHRCSVHACSRHGSRQAQYFRCLDCVSVGSLEIALNPPDTAASGSAAEPAPDAASQFGLKAFIAESPTAALAGLELFDRSFVGLMVEALLELIFNRSRAVDRVRQYLLDEITTTRAAELERALGLPTGTDDLLRGVGDGDERENIMADIARAKLLLIFAELAASLPPTVREPRIDRNRAEYALAVVAGAFAVRDAESVTTSVLWLLAGLQMPPVVIVLSTLLRTYLDGGSPGARWAESHGR